LYSLDTVVSHNLIKEKTKKKEETQTNTNDHNKKESALDNTDRRGQDLGRTRPM
jgi:hypothetical protein